MKWGKVGSSSVLWGGGGGGTSGDCRGRLDSEGIIVVIQLSMFRLQISKHTQASENIPFMSQFIIIVTFSISLTLVLTHSHSHTLSFSHIELQRR